MENSYIHDLIEKLENTEIIYSNIKLDFDKGINKLFEAFSEHKYQESQLFFIGNGGSSAIASHMTADFMKNGGMKTYSLYDNAVTTCMGNDYGYSDIFSRPLEFLMKENDLLVAISSSGNSQNIINAINVAKGKKARVITFTGFSDDNKAKQLGDINVYVPSNEYGKVESIHNLILQQIADMIKDRDGEKL